MDRRIPSRSSVVYEKYTPFPGTWKQHFRLTSMRETQKMRASKRLWCINRSLLSTADQMLWPPRLTRWRSSTWQVYGGKSVSPDLVVRIGYEWSRSSSSFVIKRTVFQVAAYAWLCLVDSSVTTHYD